MSVLSEIYLDIKKIHIAHEATLDSVRRCSYPRGRGSYGFVYSEEGSAVFSFSSGERVRAEEGTLLFISPTAAYSIATDGEFRHYTVNFDIHMKSSALGFAQGRECIAVERNTEQAARCFRRLVDIRSSKKAGYDMRSVGCLYELVAMFELAYTESDVSYNRLLPAKEYIESSFDKDITLDELSFLCNMSKTNFRREWRARYTDTPIRYRDSIRLHHAREYLTSGYYSVSEVAKKCGFEDVSYFVRFFRKHTGLTPGAVAKAN